MSLANTDIDELISVVHDHIDIILASDTTRIIDLTDRQMERFSNDFYGLLNDLNVPPPLHQVCLLLNGLTQPYEITNKTFIYAPSSDFLNTLIRNNKT